MRLSLPLSIVLAGAFVGLGLYFGLRERAPATPSPAMAPAGSVPASAQQGTPKPVPAPVPAPALPSPEQQQAEVAALVAGAKARWKAACWDTADPATRTPGRYISTLAFDATGKLTVSGVGEIREESDPGVGQCIRLLVNNDFRITPPGRTVVFEIPFEMP